MSLRVGEYRLNTIITSLVSRYVVCSVEMKQYIDILNYFLESNVMYCIACVDLEVVSSSSE